MIDYLLLDLDNTLYPQEAGLGLEMSRLMTEFVAGYLRIPAGEAQELRRESVRHHGTTLAWLRAEYGFTDTDAFLEAVHPADLSPWITEAHAQAARDTLSEIDLPAAILTNGPREHALRVLDRLGIQDRFERLFDLRSNGFVGKPARSAYERPLQELGVAAHTTLFVDDVVQYLLPFRDLGGMIVHMATPGSGTDEIPTISTLRDLVSIIYPDRSRG